MKLFPKVLAIAAVAAILSVVPARADAQAAAGCPAGTSNPLTVLTGVWSYNLSGFVSTPYLFPFASAGQFTAAISTVTGAPTLSITQSTTDGARLETATGAFSVNADCSGGTLTFFTSSRGLTFDFWFANGFSELRLVSTTSTTSISGTVRRF